MNEEFPRALKKLIEEHKLKVLNVPRIQSTDEKVRQCREWYCDTMLLVSIILKKNDSFVIVRYSDVAPPNGWTIELLVGVKKLKRLPRAR